MLLAAHRYAPSYLYGIDIQPEAIAVDGKEYGASPYNECGAHAQDICDAALEKVDVIVCNPPYFKVDQESNLNESQSLQMARMNASSH